MNHLIAAVLCGGESKRMGSDKGLLPIQDQTWATFMAGKLLFLRLPVFFSVNASQVQAYSSIIPTTKLIVDNLKIKGPVGGLLSVHHSMPRKDILLVACDMLDLDKDTIQTLVSFYRLDRKHDFYVYQDKLYAQPFCGIYTAGGMENLKNDATLQSMDRVSMQSILNKGHTMRMPVNQRAAFKNYNSPGQ